MLRERAADKARADLGDQAFDSAFSTGERLSLDQALAYALDEKSSAHLPAQRQTHGLTPREYEIAQLVASGMSNREMARSLVLSQRTVENHVQRILTKLGLSSRTQVAIWALQDEPGRDRF